MFVFINILSFMRAPLAFIFLIDNFFLRICVIFVAMITDILDGYLARKYRVVSRFGTILDPIMDKFFVIFVSYILHQEQQLELWQMLALIFRDICLMFFLVYLIFILRHNLSKLKLKPVLWGKITTFIQFTILICVIYKIILPWSVFVIFIVLGVLTLRSFYLSYIKVSVN
jgi:CDP-diacylglycerol---glycerol-3-phosphate 3-phosphatidyltransferase